MFFLHKAQKKIKMLEKERARKEVARKNKKRARALRTSNMSASTNPTNTSPKDIENQVTFSTPPSSRPRLEKRPALSAAVFEAAPRKLPDQKKAGGKGLEPILEVPRVTITDLTRSDQNPEVVEVMDPDQNPEVLEILEELKVTVTDMEPDQCQRSC